MTRDDSEQVLDLARWIDTNHTSVVQALRMAARSNTADAERLEAEVAANGDTPGWPGPTSAVVAMMRDSARSWQRMADELTSRVEAITVDLYDA